MNLYAYVANSPINYKDPSGTASFVDKCGNVIDLDLSVTIPFINVQYDFLGKISLNFLANWTFGGGIDISVNRPAGLAATLTGGSRHFGAGTYLPLATGSPAYEGLLVSIGMSTPSFPINLQIPITEWQLQRYRDSYVPPEIPICLQKKAENGKSKSEK